MIIFRVQLINLSTKSLVSNWLKCHRPSMLHIQTAKIQPTANKFGNKKPSCRYRIADRTARIDYCNSLLSGCSQQQIDKLQLRSQSHLQLRSARSCDATAQRQPPLATRTGAILLKLCLMVYRALSGLSYITELCVPVASIRPRSSLRSAAHGTLFVPRTRLELGKRAFAVAAPAAWNSLPDDVRSAPTLDKFKQCLKTHLFIQSYYS